MRDNERFRVPHTHYIVSTPTIFYYSVSMKRRNFVHNYNKIYHTRSVEIITIILVLLNDLSRLLGEWRISKNEKQIIFLKKVFRKVKSMLAPQDKCSS